jgi:uncharacterized protein
MSEVARLKVHVIPGAKRTEISGWHGDAVRLRCAAPPVEGKANETVTDFLAARLGVRRSAVHIVHGLRSREKLITIEGISTVEACERLGVTPR